MVRTRIAPSPTGQDLHVGNAYTALINYAYAKKNNGQFIVRIEDTDQKRKVKGAEERIFKSLSWLGLYPDESPLKGGKYEPYRQSERLNLYRKYAEELIKKKAAYREGGAVRLKMPKKGETVFEDLIRGKVRFQNKLINDQVILKSDGYPTYHLAVVVDDYLMRITHIIRGEEWISSVPKHIRIYKALGWELPVFVHTPLLRNPDKTKLSKRKNPVWVSWYRKQGFLPEALLNYLGLIGFSMPDGREVFSLDEFIREFELEKISTSAPVFDTTKLEWMNGEYIRKTKSSKLKAQILNYIGEGYDKKIVEKTIPLIQTRIKKFSEYLPMCGFFFKRPKSYEIDLGSFADWISFIVEIYKQVSKWEHNILYEKTKKAIDGREENRRDLFMSLRVAITGNKIGPPLFESMELLGKKECLLRLKSAI